MRLCYSFLKTQLKHYISTIRVTGQGQFEIQMNEWMIHIYNCQSEHHSSRSEWSRTVYVFILIKKNTYLSVWCVVFSERSLDYRPISPVISPHTFTPFVAYAGAHLYMIVYKNIQSQGVTGIIVRVPQLPALNILFSSRICNKRRTR